jgi:hypothetical protein
MNYDLLKAFLETSRTESAALCNSKREEYRKPDTRPDWKYWDYVAKQRVTAW